MFDNLAVIGDPFVFQNPSESYLFHFPEWIIIIISSSSSSCCSSNSSIDGNSKNSIF